MEIAVHEKSNRNNYILYGIIAVVVIILVILVIYFATRPVDNNPQPPPLPDDNFTRLLNDNIGNKFILRTPNTTLSLTFQGFNVAFNQLLPNNFTVVNSPLTISFKYSDVFDPPISTIIGALYSIYTTSEEPISDIFNYTLVDYKLGPHYICLAFEVKGSCPIIT